jgi:hypothetical protein
MNNKQLAEMIKHLRKEKLEQLQEYQVRSGPTHGYVGSKLPKSRMSIRDKNSQPKSGKDMKNRYKLSTVVETEQELTPDTKKTDKKKVKKGVDTIDFQPQQSDEKIF